MTIAEDQEIAKRITQQFPDIKVECPLPNRIDLECPPSITPTLAAYLRDVEELDHVTSVTGIDYPDTNSIRVTYHLSAYAKPAIRRLVVSISVNLPREQPTMPSLLSVWPSAEFHERETNEMVGVIFEDHPNLNRLLLPEDWNDPPPLRKDFKLRGR